MFSLSPFAFPSISVPTGGGGATPVLDWQLIDVTSGFTKTTPDAMTISSEAIDSGTGVTTFTMGALSTGNEKYNISGSNSSWPRYYAALNDSDGVRLTTDDSFIMFVRISLFRDVVPSQDLRYVTGLCIDPTALTISDFDGYGIGIRTNSFVQRGGHFKADTSSALFTTHGVATTDTVFGSIQRSARRLGVVVAFGEFANASVANARTVPSTSNTLFTAGADYSLFVAVGTRTNSGTITSGQTFALRADYAIKRLR